MLLYGAANRDQLNLSTDHQVIFKIGSAVLSKKQSQSKKHFIYLFIYLLYLLFYLIYPYHIYIRLMPHVVVTVIGFTHTPSICYLIL